MEEVSRLTVRFSYPYVLDLRDIIGTVQSNGYTVPLQNLPTPVPGSVLIGNFTGVKDNVVLEFNNSSGVMSFSAPSLDHVVKAVDDFKEITKEFRLGEIDFVELSSETLLRGRLKLDCKVLGKELSGFDVTDENSSIRVLPYPALRDAYVLIVTYKYRRIEETGRFLGEVKGVIGSLKGLMALKV
ncbi:hypothetical protein GWK48_10370 [Metallosphaera tengchongensis]|uniref:Uncharacterized protein n=1 Tax=Metallosphaera tengchongensis TaxID=1532350 RepID=A0A6N0P0J1_9CREN|nr:hypothetical protein GWK48_10370 [Metallosphaera tengchongensis]